MSNCTPPVQPLCGLETAIGRVFPVSHLGKETASPSGLGLPKIYLDVFKYLPGISSKGKKINLSLVFSSFEQERSVFVLPAASILYPSCPEVNLSRRLAIMGRDGSFFLPQESRLNALSPRGLVPSLVK